MNLLILHRYPFEQAIGTNASLPAMFKYLHKRFEKVVYLSYKSINSDCTSGIFFEEINSALRRGNPFDKIIKSLMWIFLSPLYSIRLVKKYNVDLIYCDDSLPYYPYLIKILIGKRCKVIMRLGDLQTGYLFANKGLFWKIIFKFFHFIEVFVWKRIDGIIPISLSMTKYVEQEGVSSAKIFMVKESININRFYPQTSDVRKKYGVSDTDTVVMFHGAIEKAKGVEVLLGAAEILKLQQPRLYIFIVGHGTEFFKIESTVREKKLTNVILTGWVDFSDMPLYINTADIGIALRKNNMGNHFVVTTALMQYWACEKPLIAPGLDSIKEVLRDGVNGLCYRAGDFEDLAEKISFMLSCRSKWNEMGRAGRRTVRDNFEMDQIGKHMSDVLGALSTTIS